ncbi:MULTISPECIES: hypothetical protein [Dyella]|uniref:Uncharacterized protein n=2 Tax=Dyella TaxID=231454 RepID=A0A4R0YY80_9GAMM|nr:MULTISPECIES: hypothetical protein [Dyella]TBR40440.1 hypothetical protein EYV96_09870 [Dyella terrae]TCI11978.1 hypothetical protein EZM97_01000 [Dyella soli]
MSWDFAVWYPHARTSPEHAAKVYARLCEGDESLVQPHPSVAAFYRDLVAIHPDLDDASEDDVDAAANPWSYPMERSDAYVIVSCQMSKVGQVEDLVNRLVKEHGLALYDPQSERLTSPGDAVAPPRPWWKIWSLAERTLQR